MKKIKVKTLIFSLTLIILMTAMSVTSCVTFSNPDTTTAAATTTAAEATYTGANLTDTTWTPIASQNELTGSMYSIADVAAMVKPAVVAITTEVVSYDLFNRPYTQEGAGSGWIIDPDGIIVTNNHVVEGAKNITVTLDNGDSYSADMESVFTDSYTDLAIIKINATGLPYLKTGDASELRLGDWVVAIGNALGQGTRVTQGIISRDDVALAVDYDQTLYNLIETSAAINPGNSGGPLVNLYGEVVGITSAKIASVGVEGMGYAISINTAVPIIEELVNKGYVTRPYLGVSLYTVDNLAIREFKLKVDTGVLILDVVSDGPASLAGLEVGDVVVSIDGVEVTTIQEMTNVLHNSVIGEPIEITYWRDNDQATIMVTPVAAPRTTS